MTWYWYHYLGSSAYSHGDKKPVAYVERAKDEIHRRPVTRIIWQLVNDGEPVYPGEAIRTSTKGEVRIQFADSPRFIDLESDSLIVISQGSHNEISLDLLDGSVMVGQGAAPTGDTGDPKNAPGATLTLKSGDTKVDLSKATASLSKSKSGNIDLRVLEGKAKIENEKGQSQEIGTGTSGAIAADGTSLSSNNLQILSPHLDLPFSFDPSAPQPVLFSWKGFPANSVVTLQAGSTRKELKDLATTKESSISQKIPAGKNFWKLVAKDPATQKIVAESPLYRLDVVPRIPPVLVSPAANEKILKVSADQKVDFRWVVPAQSQKVTLEVYKDSGLKDKVFSQAFTQEEHFAQSLPEGEYYLRLLAKFDEKSPEISSTVQQFQFTTKKAPPPAVVQWLSPAANSPLYYIEKPVAQFSWVSAKPVEGQSPVHTWRLKWGESEPALSSLEAQALESKEPRLKIPFEKPGRYLAVVEGLDEKNQIVAVSNVQTFELAPMPLLKAPELLPGEGDLNADNQGRLDLKWTAVEGAKEYKVILYDNKGVEKRAAKFSKTSTTLVNLLPGEHKVEVQAIDPHGRSSEKAEPRLVRVPASSGLLSPKIRKMKVN